MTSTVGSPATVARFVAVALLASTLALVAATGPAQAAENPPSFITKWGTPGTGTGQFQGPYAVALDGTGNVYVTDTNNHRIQKFSSDGTFLTQWGTEGSANGQFQNPYGIVVDGTGNVYVADLYNNRIQKFTSNGTFITKWGSFGSGNGQFQGPVGVAVDSLGNVYVADDGNHRVQKFTSTGTYITQWGGLGSGNGQFHRAFGLAVDSNDNVYVADHSNNRIQKFTSNGTFITAWGSLGTGDGQFTNPVRVAIDGHDNVYVADSNNFRVQKFTSTGSFLTRWGTQGAADGQFGAPYGVAVDSIGTVYVADTANDRIQVFGDLTDPTVTISTPPDGATYARNAAVVADYACSDEPGGSGIDTCVGTAADGSPISTSTIGPHGFIVTVTDAAGNTTEVTHTYTVEDVTDPTVDLQTPSSGATYARNESVPADYSCSDDVGGSGIDTCEGTVADGSPVATSVLGDHDFTVTATDAAGNTTEVTHTYSVEDVTNPSVEILTPPEGAIYARNATVSADYSCADESGGSGIDTCVGTVANGSSIDTSTIGDHDFTVTATDAAGNTTEVTHTYTVEDVTNPTVDLRTPLDGAIYSRGQVVGADYSCADDAGGSGVDACVGTALDGAAIDTSTVGEHDFTVTATDVAGNVTPVTHTYTVADPQPDGRIKRGATGTYFGDNVYNTTGTGQTRNGSATRGGTVTYFVSVQNDAPFPDELRLRGTATTTRFRVLYSTGGFDITSHVTDGTYTTPTLAPGEALVVKVEVKAKSSAPIGSSLTGTVTTRSTTDLTRQDKVKFVTSRR